MEPCDSKMDACQLIGPYKRALQFLQRMHAEGLPRAHHGHCTYR